ncbi:LADA_0H08768g1_1 [Lachancea dasiensis]|uniref:Guanine-nucleotide exchange factor YEL1 n=1 Tax=Lachancea dasiensis TaxID=1072105 RepID=A0A1G4K2J4_9SACH|nr:LADA_0H08768g1_1 [Lachancea dasiensis]
MASAAAVDHPSEQALPPAEGILTPSPKIANIHEIVGNSTSYPEAKNTAVRILSGRYDKIDYKEYANFLGSTGNGPVLHEFLLLLQPLPGSLTGTLRKLSTSIYFIAEAANIDTILEGLAQHWLQAHRKPHYLENYRLCHIVMFALLMLNSTLHSDAADCKFTLQQFQDNTIYALEQECPEIDVPTFRKELGGSYLSLEREQLPLLRSNAPNTRKPLISRAGTRLTRSSSNNMKKLSMLSMKGSSLERLHSNQSTGSTPSSMGTFTSRDTATTSNFRLRNNLPLQRLYIEEPFDVEMRNRDHTPWLIDTVVHYQETSNAHSSTPQLLAQLHSRKRKLLGWFKKHSRDSLFKENAHATSTHHLSSAHIRVQEGRLFVHQLKSRGSEHQESRALDLERLRKANSHCHVYNLYGALASFSRESIVASENSNITAACVTVDFPHALDSATKFAFLFETQTVAEAKHLTECVNFWSARMTPIPSAQIEMISNEEYGWGPHSLSQGADLSKVKLARWAPLVGLDSFFEDLEEGIALWDYKSQLQGLKSYTSTIQNQLDDHHSLKPKMLVAWAGNNSGLSSQTDRFEEAMDNWNNKYLYLNQQYSKFSVYLKALENASKLYQDCRPVCGSP